MVSRPVVVLAVLLTMNLNWVVKWQRCRTCRVLLLKWCSGLLMVCIMFWVRLLRLLKGLYKFLLVSQVTVPTAKLCWVRLLWMLGIKVMSLGRWLLEQSFLAWKAATLQSSLLCPMAMALRRNLAGTYCPLLNSLTIRLGWVVA